MPGEAMRFRNPAGHAGLLNNLLSVLNALVGFFETRVALFGFEAKAALTHIIVLVACLAAALALVALGYVFLLVSGIVAVAHALGISWVWIAMMVAGFHFVLAFIALLIAHARLTHPMFEATAAELKRDRQWLKELDQRSRWNS
jgi:uncharacterized membrane protein YqjE